MNIPSRKSASFTRRSLLTGAAALCAHRVASAAAPVAELSVPDTSALKQAARRSGIPLGTYTTYHELFLEPASAEMIARTFSMIADGNDLKFANRLRPTPEDFDFILGDKVVGWAEAHHMLFRGHCLVWWNALPDWFQSYVKPANARQVLTHHITTVVKRYAGRVYAWDVVNESLHNDGRPDYLRRKPWVDLIGPEYIDLALHTAAEADPKALLVLNQCYIEHNTPAELANRAALVALATRLRKAGVPLSAVGIQCHLRGATPLDGPGVVTFCKQIKDLGLDIMITELDVDDVDVPAPSMDQVAASKYKEILELTGPYLTSITLEALHDEPQLRRPDGVMHRPNLFDDQYRPTPSYQAVVQALEHMPRPAGKARL